jgi:hypothetical protein
MKIILTFIFLFLFPEVFAYGEFDSKNEFRVLFQTQISQAQIYLIAREEGHLLGQPYQIELRVNCNGDKKEIMELKVKDSFSVCDMQPESVKINNKKTALAMKVKVANINDYYQDIEKGIKSPQVKCGLKTKIKKFSLLKLCKN